MLFLESMLHFHWKLSFDLQLVQIFYNSFMLKTMQHVCFVINTNPTLISLNCWKQVIQLKSFLDHLFFSLLDDEISLVLTPKKTVYFPFPLLIIRYIVRLHPRNLFSIRIEEEHINLSSFWSLLKREIQKTIKKLTQNFSD